MQPYLIDADAIARWATARGYRKLLFQAPDGIKRFLIETARELEERGFEIALSGSHAWGGCDVALTELTTLCYDALVHVGHHGPVRFRAPENVLFVPAYSTADVNNVIENAAAKLSSEGVRAVGLLSTVQHLHKLEQARQLLLEYGIKAFTSKSPDPMMPEGLVIGCDSRAAEKLVGSVEAFLVVAGGIFHALGVALATGGRTFAADPYTGRVVEVDQLLRSIVAKRLAHLAAVMESQNGILVVSSKPGQRACKLRVDALLKSCLERGLKLWLVIFDEVSHDALLDYGGAEVFVNAACPRLSIDDPHVFPGPVVNASELETVLKNGLAAYEPRLALQPFV